MKCCTSYTKVWPCVTSRTFVEQVKGFRLETKKELKSESVNEFSIFWDYDVIDDDIKLNELLS